MSSGFVTALLMEPWQAQNDHVSEVMNCIALAVNGANSPEEQYSRSVMKMPIAATKKHVCCSNLLDMC